MAPSSPSMVPADGNGHSAQGMRKLRKPVIEKMRRDRINSSIEQLRVLLEKEFHKQHLPSKPEKADILEMTVTLLQQHLAEKTAPSSSQSYTEGYSKCLQVSECFLSQHRQAEAQVKLLQNIHWTQTLPEGELSSKVTFYQAASKHTAPETTKVMWRPW
ncbi:transcription factor HES-5-like [Pelobates cultripes]|uniref:Transcription factor HES-5 n=1 Tax=Pelobates cultripes TaxID=61616 RepID=A0AAD1TBP9_PELCU|nr:transcription factor HES-5-like [Pelobates cultripes]